MSRRKKSGNRFLLAVALLALFFAGGFITAMLAVKNSPKPTPARHADKREVASLPPVANLQDAPPPSVQPRYRVAIIIDDIGLRNEPVEKLLSLGIPITFAIMPGQRHTKELAEKIRNAGYEVLLHMPMEPEDYKNNNPGEEALLVSQTDEEIRAMMRRTLAEVPQAIGVNNHMGSLFTRDGHKMRVVMEEIKSAGLFFVDSLTTPKSVGLPLARKMGIKSAARRLFLDNDENPESVENALRNSIRLAKVNGDVIAIGHPHAVTVEAITALKDAFAKEGVDLVAVSGMVR